MQKIRTLLAAAITSALTLLLTGCAGTSSALLSSSTNIGIDIDSKPPQADISISRKEIAVQPGFEGGETLPAVMSFSNKNDVNFLSKLFVGITSTFSTGRAAVALTSNAGAAASAEPTDDVRVSRRPKAHRIVDEIGGQHRNVVGPGQLRPLVFGTKTIFGLHASWDGSNVAPADLKIGFNRKEVAYAPVGYRPDVGEDGPGTVQIPSTIATIENNTGTAIGGGNVGHTQYFATGRAATNLANRQEIRDLLMKRIEPAAEPMTDDTGVDPSVTQLNDYLFPDGKKSAEHFASLRSWLDNHGLRSAQIPLFRRGSGFRTERASFLQTVP